jgi:hypothetical protein
MTQEEKIDRLITDVAGIGHRLATIEGLLAGMDHRLAGLEGRLAHLQTIGTWLFAGLLASYAAILAVALRVIH